MSMCRCCLTPHPLRLIERLKSSIETIKFIRKNCSIFENILLDEYEHFERISLNLNKYLRNYNPISNEIFSYLTKFLKELNNRLENLTKFLYKIEHLTIKCTIWLKTNSIKSIYSQLKSYEKQFNFFNNLIKKSSYIKQYKISLKKNFSKTFSIFHTNYHQQCLQMDSIEFDYIKLFLESIQIFFSIITLDNNNNMIISTININKSINEWKEKNKFHITWLPNEHHQVELDNQNKSIEKISSDIQIKTIDYSLNDNQDKYTYQTNLSWSFTIPKKEEEEDLLSPTSSFHQSIEDSKPSQSTINISKFSSKNRVRLAIEAIEQNTKNFPRERKS